MMKTILKYSHTVMLAGNSQSCFPAKAIKLICDKVALIKTNAIKCIQYFLCKKSNQSIILKISGILA